MKRVVTAVILIPLVLGLIFWASNRSVRLALTFVALLCLSEFLKLAAHYGVATMRLVAYLAGAWVVAWQAAPGAPFFLGVTLLLLTLAMRGGRELSSALPGAAATLLGIVYTAIPFRLAADLHAASPHWLLYVLLINWIGDTAAYYAGRALGRHKLAPRISPAKTWEGAAASLLVSVPLATLYLTHYLPHSPSGTFVLALSVAANVAAQIGDLAESTLKRGAGVKDSGGLLPGHGGALDRLDGLLFSAPVVWLAVAWLAPR
ncbi:MAG TPA: phosphatidate cytidylyltransferase [Bryobacterales bacterium]|nr:phosphatidate cytidylyltransferase [Bryobacterales bacterium]